MRRWRPAGLPGGRAPARRAPAAPPARLHGRAAQQASCKTACCSATDQPGAAQAGRARARAQQLLGQPRDALQQRAAQRLQLRPRVAGRQRALRLQKHAQLLRALGLGLGLDHRQRPPGARADVAGGRAAVSAEAGRWAQPPPAAQLMDAGCCNIKDSLLPRCWPRPHAPFQCVRGRFIARQRRRRAAGRHAWAGASAGRPAGWRGRCSSAARTRA